MKNVIGRLVSIILPVLAFGLPFLIYLFTLYPAIAPGDSTEMVTAAIVLGVPHQPSYPVNTFLGYLASRQEWMRRPSFEAGRLSFQTMNPVERVNAVSAFLQALTVLMFYFLLLALFKLHLRGVPQAQHHLGGGEKLAAFTGSMFLAFSLIFWQYGTKFEVFPLNNLFAVSLLFLVVKIGLREDSFGFAKKIFKGQDKDQNRAWDWRFLLLALVGGLALTHHQTIILVIPAAVYLLWKPLMKLVGDWKRLAVTLAAFLIGTLPFFLLLLWIASRKPPLNWGEVEGVGGALAALVRRDFGTFGSFLVGSSPVARATPVEQVVFYLKYLILDFSVVGIGLAIYGGYLLYRRERRIFWFLLLGFLFTGIVFLSYANFPLADSFNQATVRRFHQLPNLFVALAISFGIAGLYRLLEGIRVRKTAYLLGVWLGKAYVFLLFVFLILVNFGKANERGNTLTSTYARQAYGSTEPDAMILLSGDIPNMTVDYFRMVELSGKDSRVSFTPGQFHLPWFTPQLLRKYPALFIPFPSEGKQFTTTTQIVDANYGKGPVYVGPDLVVHDPELEKKYVLYPKNLLFLVKKKGEDLKLEDYRTENDALWDGINLEMVKKVRRNAPMFEETLVFYFARHFFNAGFMYEEVKLYDDAIREYKRVLEIDPYFKEALASLARVYGYKLEPPDYAQAIDYLSKYQSVLSADELELGQAAQGMIFDIQQKAAEAAAREATASAEEATPSGEATPAGEGKDSH